MRTCNFCNADISHRHFNSTYCDLKCRNKHYSIIRTEKLKLESIDFYKNKPSTSYVICQICGHCDSDLSNHILKIHNMTCADYKKIKKCCNDNELLLIDLFYDYDSAFTTSHYIEYHRYTHCKVMDKYGKQHNVSDSSDEEVINNIKNINK